MIVQMRFKGLEVFTMLCLHVLPVSGERNLHAHIYPTLSSAVDTRRMARESTQVLSHSRHQATITSRFHIDNDYRRQP